MPVTTVTREQLYERLWQTPTVHLCKEFGLSDVGLAKLCKRHKIPKPYLGYWARKAAGANPRISRLPKCSDPNLATIRHLQSEVPIQPSGFFDPEIEKLYEAELKRDRIVVQAELHAKWEAEERAKELARQAAEKKRREEALFERARQWKKCQELRDFVHAVRDLAEERPLPEGAQQEASDWIEWAMGVADAYDPLATWAEQLPERVQKPR